MALLGFEYEVGAVDIAEDLDGRTGHGPAALAATLAEEKALAAREEHGPDQAIVACDTLVLHQGRVLGKPRGLADARAMLRSLAGRHHRVVTGVALFAPGRPRPRVESVTTDVLMHDLTDEQVEGWVAKGELLGCAGAYNIESHLASVEPDECYQNVAGLPACHLYAWIREGGLGAAQPAGLTSPVRACDEARGARCLLGPTLVGGG